MSTTLLERFRKNVEAKKDESEFLDASIEFLDDIEREIKEGIDAGKVLTKEEKKELSSVFPDKCREMIRNMSSRLEKEGALYPIDKQGNELKPFVYF